jgi:hypothetical protein
MTTSPRPGSRPWVLLNLGAGESVILEAPSGRLQSFMQQVNTDINRAGLRGQVRQQHLLAIQPKTRVVYDLVRVERLAAQLPLEGTEP